jgi:carboxylesterase type B
VDVGAPEVGLTAGARRRARLRRPRHEAARRRRARAGHRTGPGLTRQYGAYEWGAGHAAELAYLFPSFNNGEPITPLFNAGERALAEHMKVYWGAFVKQGVPSDKTGATWPIFNAAGQVMSLHSNDRSFVLSTEMFDREHNCKFWEEIER